MLESHPELKAQIDGPMADYGAGTTPLLAAVQRSDRKTIDVLLRAGADINARSHFWAGGLSLSVLHACAHDMAAFLIERAPPWMRMQPPASAGSKSCRTW